MITVETLSTCKLQQYAHYNGGKAWFGYGHRCIEHPRLSCIDRCDRKTRTVTREWFVDGKSVKDFAAAAEALNIAPDLSGDDIAVLSQITSEWVDRRKELDVEARMRLTDKGFIEWMNGKCRLTMEGAAVLVLRGLT